MHRAPSCFNPLQMPDLTTYKLEKKVEERRGIEGERGQTRPDSRDPPEYRHREIPWPQSVSQSVRQSASRSQGPRSNQSVRQSASQSTGSQPRVEESVGIEGKGISGVWG